MTITREREARLMEAKADLAGQMKVWCDRHALTSDEALALCAYMTGAAIAYQDQRKMTKELVWRVIADNIEAGNQAAMAEVMSAGGVRQ